MVLYIIYILYRAGVAALCGAAALCCSLWCCSLGDVVRIAAGGALLWWCAFLVPDILRRCGSDIHNRSGHDIHNRSGHAVNACDILRRCDGVNGCNASQLRGCCSLWCCSLGDVLRIAAGGAADLRGSLWLCGSLWQAVRILHQANAPREEGRRPSVAAVAFESERCSV